MTNNVMNMDGSFKPFRAWCQHVLPLVYDDSLSYMELLNKVIVYINSFGEYLEEYTVINKITYEGIWDITKNYKANSVVSDHTYGYLSVKAVPAGVPITNTEYWLKIADFAGELIDLGSRVIVLEGKMTQAESDIDTLQSDMTTAQGNITNLDVNVTRANVAIDQLNQRVDALNLIPKRRYILVGDSYSLGVVGGGAPQTTGWADYAETKLDDINEKVYRYHPDQHEPIEGVAGFAGGVFLQYLQAIEEELDCENADITDIVVLGGSNEFGYTDVQIETAINTFFAYTNSHFINAEVKIGIVGIQARRLYENVYTPYKNATIKNGGYYIDTTLNLYCNPVFDSGYGHLSYAGYEYTNPFVLEAIRFGKTSYIQTPIIDLTPASDVTVEAGTFDFKLYVRITEKSISYNILDSTRFNAFILKLVNKSGTSLSGTMFTTNVTCNFAIGDVCNATCLIKNNSGYTYTPVRTGHIVLANGNQINYSFGFPFYNTWSGAGIDSNDNSCYVSWNNGAATFI